MAYSSMGVGRSARPGNIAQILAGILSNTGDVASMFHSAGALTPGDTSNASLQGVRIGGDGPRIGSSSTPQAPDNPETLLQMLMQQAMGGTSRSAVRAATAPQAALVDALQGQLAQTGAQTDQNMADIDSWMGQLGGIYNKGAKQAARGGKRAAKSTAKLGRGLMAGIADKNVAQSVGNTSARQAGYLRVQGNEAANFARAQGRDAGREAEYLKLVQQRLGMQQEADIRTQLAQAQAAKVSARSSAKSSDMGQLLQVLGLVGDNPALDKMLGVPGGGESSYGTTEGNTLRSALGNVPVFNDEDAGGGTVNDANLQDIIARMYAAANAAGLPVDSPEVKNAIRSYIAANVLPGYNALPNKDYKLQNGSFLTTN